MSLLKRIEQGQSTSDLSDSEGSEAKSRSLNLHTRRVAPPGVGSQKDTYTDLKNRVQARLLSELDPSMDISKISEVRTTIQNLF